VRFEIVRGGQQKITDAQLDLFEKDEVKCLINCMVLTEGFDCPSIQTVWVRDSSKGPTMQMGGRVFRQHPDLDYKQIVQSRETGWPFIKTAMPLQQFVWINNGWQTLKVNPKIDSVNEMARMAIASTETSMPKFILDRKAKKRARRRFR
jgi:superfamily II DNA or RNA helicase